MMSFISKILAIIIFFVTYITFSRNNMYTQSLNLEENSTFCNYVISWKKILKYLSLYSVQNAVLTSENNNFQFLDNLEIIGKFFLQLINNIIIIWTSKDNNIDNQLMNFMKSNIFSYFDFSCYTLVFIIILWSWYFIKNIIDESKKNIEEENKFFLNFIKTKKYYFPWLYQNNENVFFVKLVLSLRSSIFCLTEIIISKISIFFKKSGKKLFFLIIQRVITAFLIYRILINLTPLEKCFSFLEWQNVFSKDDEFLSEQFVIHGLPRFIIFIHGNIKLAEEKWKDVIINNKEMSLKYLEIFSKLPLYFWFSLLSFLCLIGMNFTLISIYFIKLILFVIFSFANNWNFLNLASDFVNLFNTINLIKIVLIINFCLIILMFYHSFDAVTNAFKTQTILDPFQNQKYQTSLRYNLSSILNIYNLFISSMIHNISLSLQVILNIILIF